MTEEYLRAIEQRAEAATPGPWKSSSGVVLFARKCDPLENSEGDYASPYGFSVSGEFKAAGGYLPPDEGRPTADFSAHARADVPALCAEVRRLRQALKEYADEEHWAYRTGDYTTPLDLWVGPDKGGPNIARAALGKD